MVGRQLRDRGVIAGILAALLSLAAVPAHADFDLNGNWAAGSVVLGFQILCNVDVTQVSTSLTVTGTCDFAGTINLTGTIDTMTGVFSLSGSASAFCTDPDSLTISATASDNSNFAGTLNCAGLGGSLVGSRCGNGQLDPGEQCDQGVNSNGVLGSCCSATCQYASASTTCRNAYNCDPAEMCTGTSETCPPDLKDPDGTPCGTNNPCLTNETCTSGICTNGTPVPAGTTCDTPYECIDFECDGAGSCQYVFNNDPCDDFDMCTTSDACADGYCQGGPALDCGSCQTCDSATGCFPALEPICDVPTSADALLNIREGNDPGDALLKWRWKGGPQVDLTDLGDPRTSTSYSLCVYDQDAGSLSGLRLLLEANVTPSNKWLPTAKGYKYLDANRSSDGVQLIVLKSGDAGKGKLLLKAKGGNMSIANLPATLPAIVQLKNSDGACWGANYSAAAPNSPIKLHAKGGP